MPNRLSLNYFSVLYLFAGLLALPSSAFAGFEWKAPADTLPSPVVQSRPVATSVVPVARSTTSASSDIISPVIISGNSSAAPVSVIVPPSSFAPAPSNPTTNVNTSLPEVAVVTGKPVALVPAPLPVTTVLTPPPAPVSTASSQGVVHGFAKQVPLAVALRQILPAGYGFSVDPDVDLGVLISFQGGKPWRDTLRDALEPAGLVMREHGQMVSVGRVGGGMVAEAAPQPRPVPVAAPLPEPHMVEMLPAAPVVSTPQVMDRGPAVEEWHAERGDNLHKVIENWAARSHIELNWLAEYDYPLQASISYTGTFEEAVRNLLTGFQDAHPQPVAELHDNPGLGQRVLVVQTRGNSYAD